MAANEDWRSTAFRQKVISQIEEAVKRSGNPNVMMKNPGEMESQVYSKAKTRVDYLAYVARLLVYIRDIRPSAPGQQQAPTANMSQQPGMRPQFPSPQINKQQTVGTIGGQGTIQQVQTTTGSAITNSITAGVL
ncbi:mediator complex subunit Med15 [Desmophyllum pertusum]|uniref:Mediator of RNA polymerase II transcription subunit 15 n=1 Tax=Desmophyllum pertusum TaxID=174260 RepID=A0A9W9ZTX2_9CNID|nr:mediator complex subunit Med15 [Desmophyllum pertusum]